MRSISSRPGPVAVQSFLPGPAKMSRTGWLINAQHMVSTTCNCLLHSTWWLTQQHVMQASPSQLHGLGDLLPSRRKKNHWQLVNPCNVTCILSFDRHTILSQRHPFIKQEIEIQASKQSSQVYKDGKWQSSDFKQFIWDVLFLTHQKIKSCFFNRHSLIQTYYREVLSLSNRPPGVDILRWA